MKLKWLFIAVLIAVLIIDIDAAKKKKKKDREDNNNNDNNENGGGIEMIEGNSDDKGKEKSSNSRSSNYESGNKANNPEESDSDEDEEDDKKDKASNATAKIIVRRHRRRLHKALIAPKPQHRHRRHGNHASNGWYQIDTKGSVWNDNAAHDEIPKVEHHRKNHRSPSRRHRRTKILERRREYNELGQRVYGNTTSH